MQGRRAVKYSYSNLHQPQIQCLKADVGGNKCIPNAYEKHACDSK